MTYTVSKNPNAYRERRGLIETRRLPEARYAPGDNPVVDLPTAAPYPLPELVRPVSRPANPDSAGIRPWPGR